MRHRGFAASRHSLTATVNRRPINFRSGATAVVCILIDELMIVAHCGDCRMLIHRNEKMYQITKVRDGQRACAQRLRAKRGGRVLTLVLLQDHVPTRKVERRRVRRMGGSVTNGRVQGRLGVSRAVGDLPYKVRLPPVVFFLRLRNTVAQDPQTLGERFLTSEPDVKLAYLDHSVDYMLLASDGLFQKLSPTDIHSFIAAARNAHRSTLMQIADQLVRHAIERGADDNVSAVLIGFQHKQPYEAESHERVRTSELRYERAENRFVLDKALDVTDTEATDTSSNPEGDEPMDDVPEDFRQEPVYE